MLEKKKVASAFKWQVFNISLQAIFQFAFVMISARVIPDKGVHGAFAIINSVIFVMSIASEGGVSSAIIQRSDINKRHVSLSFYITLALSFIMFLLIAGLAQPIASFYDEKITAIELRWASLIFIFKAIGSVSRAFLVKEFRFKKVFIANNISFLIGNIIVLYILAHLDYGIYALIFGFVVTQLVQSLIYFFYARHSIKFHWGKEESKQLFHFGSSFILLRMANYLSSQVDKLLIGKFYNVTALSIFEKGQYIGKMPPKYLGNSIDAVMFSAFSKITELKKKSNYFNLILKSLLILITFFTIFLFFNARAVIQIILGNNWLETIPYLKIFVFIMPAMLLGRMGDIVVRSENKMYHSIPIKLFFLSIIVGTILLYKDVALLKLTGYIVVCYWVHGAAMLIMSMRILKLEISKLMVSLLLPIIFAIVLSVKYYGVSMFNFSPILTMGVNILTDILFFGLIIYYFRKTKIVNTVITEVKTKINKLKN